MNAVWSIVRKTVGVVLIVGGIAGLFLPFFQGVAMIIAGAILLENKFMVRQVKRLVKRFKKS